MKVTMIMLLGVLVAGPLGGTRWAAAQNSPGVDKALEAATTANNKAATTWQKAMTKMGMMGKMPMTANEKAMMDEMTMMGDMSKSLVDANKHLGSVTDPLSNLHRPGLRFYCGQRTPAPADSLSRRGWGGPTDDTRHGRHGWWFGYRSPQDGILHRRGAEMM
jgi:hypothetical protein